MTASDHHGLPTPRTTLAASYVAVLVWCKSCRHQAPADMQELIDAGKGDVPLTRLRFRCSNCRSLHRAVGDGRATLVLRNAMIAP